MNIDVSSFHQLSAWGGHAGPTSSYSYIHLYEEAVADVARSVRPHAWTELPVTADGVFEPIESGQAIDRRRALADCLPNIQQIVAGDLSLETRRTICWRVAGRLRVGSAASVAWVPEGVATTVVSDFVDAMEHARLVRRSVERNLRSDCMSMSAYFLWARAARQCKLVPLISALDADGLAGRWGTLKSLWYWWRDCIDAEHFSLDRAWAARKFIDYFLNSGIPRSSLVVKSRAGAPPLDMTIRALQLFNPEPLAERAVRAQHRLQMVDPQSSAPDASGATVSMAGVHWVMLVVGSALVSRGEV